MDLTPGNAQWQGTRSEQQDAFGFLGFDQPDLRSHGGVLLVLADGMGGMSGGGRASRLAVERMMAAYATKTPDEPVPRALERALQAANRAVYELACASEGEGEVGTTLVAVSVRGVELNWVSVGDSRLYHYRAGDDSIAQCTDDHTLVNEHLRKLATGAADPGEAPQRDALVSYLGLAQIPEIDRNRYPLHLGPGDRVLLCSDGIHGVLEETAIRTLMRGDSQGAAEGLVAAVRAQGRESQDNATAAILGLEGTGESTRRSPRLEVRPAGEERPKRRLAIPLMAVAAIVLVGLIGYLVPNRDGKQAERSNPMATAGPSQTGAHPTAMGEVQEKSGPKVDQPGTAGGNGPGADAPAQPSSAEGPSVKGDGSENAGESDQGGPPRQGEGGGSSGHGESQPSVAPQGTINPGPTEPLGQNPPEEPRAEVTPGHSSEPAVPNQSGPPQQAPAPPQPPAAPQPRSGSQHLGPRPAQTQRPAGTAASQPSADPERSTERRQSEASSRR